MDAATGQVDKRVSMLAPIVSLEEAAEVDTEFEKEMTKLDQEAREVRGMKADSKLEKEIAKTKERDKELGKVNEGRKTDDKEEKRPRKIRWLIIRNVQNPSGPCSSPDLDGYTDRQ